MNVPEWILWLAAALATVRASWFVVVEDGPWGIMQRLRVAAGCYEYRDQRGPDGMPVAKTEIGRALTCPFCVSPWFALLFSLCVLSSMTVAHVLVLVAGVSGAAWYFIRWRTWKV